MMARIALLGGMGYPITETPWGMPRLKTRLEAIGATVLLVNWSARTEVYNFMHGYLGFRAYLGDSLGAGSAGEYPGDAGGDVEYAAGFQPSDYDARTTRNAAGERVQFISHRIIRAHCIYDSVWIDTFGLGHTRWQALPDSKTRLLVTEHRGAHPDDMFWSQDLIFGELQKLLELNK